MPDRIVKTTLVIDEHGAVKSVKGVGREAATTETHLGKLDKQVKQTGKAFSGLKGVIAGGLGAIGIGGLAFGLKDVAEKTKEVATETENFSTKTGLGARSSLLYTQALKARGLSGETVTKAFGFLAKNIKSAELQEGSFARSQVKAAGKGQLTTSVLGRQAQAFKELGINLSTFNNLSEQQKLETITQKFEALKDGTTKLRLERELFGKGGNALSTVLDKNNLGLSHQIDLAKKFFPTIKDGGNAMKELIEKQAESKMAWEGLEFTLGTKLIPAITAVEGWFAGIAAEAQKGKGPLHEIESVFEGIAHFAGGAIGVAKELFKIFGVKLPTGTLGAVLTAVGLHSIKHPVKSTKGAGKATKDLAKWTLAHPEFAPFTAGILIGGAAGIPLNKKVPQGLFPGPNQNEIERTLLGLPRHGTSPAGGVGHERLGGGVRGGSETPGEAAAVARAIEKLAATHDQHQYVLNMDGAKVAEGLLKNPRARREIAEAMSIYAQQMSARK